MFRYYMNICIIPTRIDDNLMLIRIQFEIIQLTPLYFSYLSLITFQEHKAHKFYMAIFFVFVGQNCFENPVGKMT